VSQHSPNGQPGHSTSVEYAQTGPHGHAGRDPLHTVGQGLKVRDQGKVCVYLCIVPVMSLRSTLRSPLTAAACTWEPRGAVFGGEGSAAYNTYSSVRAIHTPGHTGKHTCCACVYTG
jgi:glyoxylase-like metal-dependent hydrolase (beta-lactamase superfamily II)